jgi:branched-chain amino acid transport system permease protein
MALCLSPSLLLLDEPTAGLTQTERAEVGKLLRQLADEGLAVVLIEHDLDFVRDITDSVAVLHHGQVQAHGTTDDVVSSPLVREIYLGTART